MLATSTAHCSVLTFSYLLIILWSKQIVDLGPSSPQRMVKTDTLAVRCVG